VSILFVTAALFFTNLHNGSLPDVNKGGCRINDGVPELRDQGAEGSVVRGRVGLE
jgi:hypothetical protein